MTRLVVVVFYPCIDEDELVLPGLGDLPKLVREVDEKRRVQWLLFVVQLIEGGVFL